ncbi:hypothetical protein TVAGG3_0576430 [Trichomonas vaginalis G3]|uniref:hypothetical protein n=1 Tax=Trichomonas vaginalis (strain ATCC PRA-98 / G3) TaxID=412133 RepID=UPI0021E5D912|nr:hypothetical protein TVAGG3_0576430 [Trichomonas vaginalis G3]KAI5522238.1 hypothetical protein TVAGG3_0576430 [Trichomonas vaginalis G3]
MSHVPPTESNLNPEEPKAPAPAPQFQQFQSQTKSKRDQEFEEGLNRLRKDYATAPIERKLFPDQKYNLGEAHIATAFTRSLCT